MRHRTWLGAAALFSLGFGRFTEEVFECEHAIDHLLECCPEITQDDFRGNCQQDYDGCEPRRRPLLFSEESRCIQELDCPALVEQGVCARADGALHALHTDNGVGGVCVPAR
jgi:hypothetical protein